MRRALVEHIERPPESKQARGFECESLHELSDFYRLAGSGREAAHELLTTFANVVFVRQHGCTVCKKRFVQPDLASIHR